MPARQTKRAPVAIVLSDLASSAYYAGGDSEKVIGKSALWFILAVMLFSYAVRAVYIEASSMFVRGGVYRVVRQAMGDTLAKLSVSALLFDYILTGPKYAGLHHFHVLALALRKSRTRPSLSQEGVAPGGNPP